MNDLIYEALAHVLAQDAGLDVHGAPPEAVVDYPAALVLREEGVGQRDGYRGGWAIGLEIRLLVLVQPRTELPEAIQAARPWARRIAALLAVHDELATENDIVVAELERLTWTVGRAEYAGIAWSAVDFQLVYQTDLQIAIACAGNEYIDTHT